MFYHFKLFCLRQQATKYKYFFNFNSLPYFSSDRLYYPYECADCKIHASLSCGINCCVLYFIFFYLIFSIVIVQELFCARSPILSSNMNCFICSEYLSGVPPISKHFRFIHRMNEKDTYICTYGGNCNKSYWSLSNLNRHFKEHMQPVLESDGNHPDSLPTPTSAFHASNHSVSRLSSFSNDDNPVISSEHASDHSNASCDEASSCNLSFFQNNANSIQEGGMAFTLKLHSKNNFAISSFSFKKTQERI